MVRSYVETIELDRSDPDYEKKIAIHNLFRAQKSLNQTYEDFAVWLSEPMIAYGFDQISRQNINEWFRCKRIPYADKFRIITLIAGDSKKYQEQAEFAQKVLDVIVDDE